MEQLVSLMTAEGLAPALVSEQAANVAKLLSELSGTCVYAESITTMDGCVLFMARRKLQNLLGAVSNSRDALEAMGLMGEICTSGDSTELHVQICETTHENAVTLRKLLPFTSPSLVGMKTSAGCGDRLGITTPGHIRALRGSGLMGVFAQQSIREMSRTQRTAEEVIDDATWGVFQEGYREGFGSDADHLKTAEDIDRCLAAGFTMFTIDPGDHVDNAADEDDETTLAEKYERLPWSSLESSPADCRQMYTDGVFKINDDLELTFTREILLRAAAKYSSAVAHTVQLYRHLIEKVGEGAFELEVSVDETATPTTVVEHFFIASELKRLGVKWVSLAPRFVGEFEKGVDYIGDLEVFEREFSQHAAVARRFGPYKISLHSGSDKFSIYPIISTHTKNLFHLKTAGTSYLEALRVVALCDPTLFREILAFAIERYPEDRASYHVSADTAKVPEADKLRDAQLAGLLDQFDCREILHVTFGSVLNVKTSEDLYRFRDRLFHTLNEHEETYYTAIAKHIGKHIAPFTESK